MHYVFSQTITNFHATRVHLKYEIRSNPFGCSLNQDCEDFTMDFNFRVVSFKIPMQCNVDHPNKKAGFSSMLEILD